MQYLMIQKKKVPKVLFGWLSHWKSENSLMKFSWP